MTDKKGVAKRVPFLITRRLPPCSQTKIRPSGAKAIAVGLVKPEATNESVNPGGTEAADAILMLLISNNEARTVQDKSFPNVLEFPDLIETSTLEQVLLMLGGQIKCRGIREVLGGAKVTTCLFQKFYDSERQTSRGSEWMVSSPFYPDSP